MHCRAGEEKKTFFRSERFYHTDEGWWFQTREGTTHGPFVSQKSADTELILYIRKLNMAFSGFVDDSTRSAEN